MKSLRYETLLNFTFILENQVAMDSKSEYFLERLPLPHLTHFKRSIFIAHVLKITAFVSQSLKEKV